MSVYFIAQIQIDNDKLYQKYIDLAEDIFRNHKGKYLAVDDAPMCLEGFWDKARIVLIEFPDKAAFKSWYCSEEYQEILQHRLDAARCNSVLISGKD